MSLSSADLEKKLAEALARIAELEARVQSLGSALPTAEPKAVASQQRHTIDPVIWNIIAAAIAAACPEPHRVVGVQLQGPPISLWAFEGRRAVFYSHYPHRR